MLIAQSDFKNYVDFSDNIANKKVLYQINDAELFDFKPLVPIEFYNALISLVDYNSNQWTRTTPYVVGNKVYSTENQKTYICIQSSTGNEPSVSGSYWTEIELSVSFNSFIKPYLVCSAFSRYLLWAGRNVSQFGLRVNSEDSSAEISDKARGELIADIENKKKHYWAMFKKDLFDRNYKYDSITYNFTNDCDISSPKPKFNIRAV